MEKTDEGGGKASQIFCLTWVRKGVAKLTPDEIALSPEEFKNVVMNKDTGGLADEDEWEDTNDSDSDSNKAIKKNGEPVSNEPKEEDDDLKEFNMEDYDDEEGDFSGISGLVMYADNCNDPYMAQESQDSEEELEEKSSLRIQPDDNLLVCARCGQHSSVLEVYVYNHNSEDFYVHHDIPLMETPLCMQWVGYDPGADDGCHGNLLAVGNFNSTIDIWDLDILNTLEPVFTIGNKKKLSKKFQHSDAILDLAWTDKAKDQLASASADNVIAIWDLELGKPTRVFREHKNKVQTIDWRPNSGENLISGSFDGKVILFDVKLSKNMAGWTLDGEVERIAWNLTDNNCFAASTDTGLVYYADRREPGSYLFKWTAHEGAIPGLAFLSVPAFQNSSVLHTASSDGSVKLWDLRQETPKLIYEKCMNTGMVHCCQINPDVDSVIACGGQKDSIRLWDITKTPEVATYFGVANSNDSSEKNDTLHPLGGGGDDDEEVAEYIEGGDYITRAKFSENAKHSLHNKNGVSDTRNKRKKKKLKTKTKNAHRK